MFRDSNVSLSDSDSNVSPVDRWTLFGRRDSSSLSDDRSIADNGISNMMTTTPVPKYQQRIYVDDDGGGGPRNVLEAVGMSSRTGNQGPATKNFEENIQEAIHRFIPVSFVSRSGRPTRELRLANDLKLTSNST